MENHDHDKFMRLAIGLSEINISTGAGGPFGAVIVKNGVFVAGSANKVMAENDPTAHAETAAIRLACTELGTYDLSGCAIYTSCEPCPMCLGAIYWARIDKIFYANTKADAAAVGFDDDHIYNEIGFKMEDRKLKFKQLLRDEAVKVFDQWDVMVKAKQ